MIRRSALVESKTGNELEPVVTRGLALLEKENWLVHATAGQALSLLTEAVQLAPNNWQLQIGLGDALSAANREEEAIIPFMTAHRLNPGHGGVCFKIGRFFLSRGLTEPAMQWLRSAVEIDAEHSEAVPALAASELKLGSRKAAARLLQDWVGAEPGNAIRQHLATAILGDSTPKSAPEEYVSGLFDEYATRFDESLNKLQYCGPQLIAEMFEQCSARPWQGGDVLDVGCGTGLVGETLRSQVRRLVGVDLSQNMLQQARVRQVYDELIHAEMTTFMRSQPGEYDAITASDVLTYVGDLSEFCSAANTALRPGGWVIAVMEELVEGSQEQSYRLNQSGRFSHGEPAIRDLFGECGFEVRCISRLPMRNEGGCALPTLTVAAELSTRNLA